MKKIKKIVIIGGVLSLFVFVLLLSTIIISFSSPVHKIFLEKNDTRISNDKQITSFLISGDENVLPAMTTDEVLHLKDVRRLLLISLLVLLISFRLSRSAWNNRLPKRTYRLPTTKPSYIQRFAMVVGAFFILIFLGISFIGKNFTQQFIYFHHIFFPQGNFFFPESSILIMTYPEQFFIFMGLSIFLLSTLLFFIIGYLSLRKIYKQ
mgnify:CR=1 FL=1